MSDKEMPARDESILSALLEEGAMEESVEAGELDDDGDDELDDTNAGSDK